METMKDKTFKEKFEELNNQLSELLQNTTPEELEREGIRVLLQEQQPVSKEIPTINAEPKTEKEFLEGLVLRLTGKKDTFIVQKVDTVSRAEVQDYAGEGPVVYPSLVSPTSNENVFEPYILFFTPDGLLAMLPYEGHCFSDAAPPKRKLRIRREY
jgi:hypothetical protein